MNFQGMTLKVIKKAMTTPDYFYMRSKSGTLFRWNNKYNQGLQMWAKRLGCKTYEFLNETGTLQKYAKFIKDGILEPISYDESFKMTGGK